MQEKSLMIFDMDGVLVDVGDSYREAVRMSVLLYLRDVVGLQVRDDGFITRRDVSLIKKKGGLNNDWDLTVCIIDTLLRSVVEADIRLDDVFPVHPRQPRSDAETLSLFRELLADRLDQRILDRAASRLGEKTLFRMYEDLPGEGKRESPLLLSRGDVTTGNLVKRIFQEIYLGGGLFRETYGEEPLVYGGAGYIERERLIPSSEELTVLAARHELGIATGRPRTEADYALARFDLTSLFPVVVSEDDIAREESRCGARLRKPHPYSLLLCMERLGHVPVPVSDRTDCRGHMYVGDMPDDMIAATRAGVEPVGFVNDRSGEDAEDQRQHRLLLERNGAGRVVGNFGDLIKFACDCA